MRRAMIRAAPARFALAAAAGLGVDQDRLLRKAGLSAAEIADDEQRVSLHAVGRLLEAAAQLSGCAHFGLLAGSQARIELLGYLGAIARHAATVRAAVDIFARMAVLHSEGSGIMAVGSAERPAFAYVVHETRIPGYDHLVAASLAITANVLKALCGPQFRLDAVYLPQSKPKDAGAYARVFGTMPQFNADEATVCFARRWLEQAPVETDPQRATELLHGVGGSFDEDLVLRLKRVLRHAIALGRGAESEADVARALHMSDRSLRRSLHGQQLSYRDIVSDVRQDVARHLMRSSALSLTEVSLIVGYANLSAFSRARRRWDAQDRHSGH